MAAKRTNAYIYKDGYWNLIGSASGSAAIVAPPTPAPPDLIGQFWIDPTALPGDFLVTDVLEAIRGQVISPKAIDLDGPNTLYITTDADGVVKLSLRADSTKAGKLDNVFASERWVLDNAGNVWVGDTAPSNPNTIWINPTGVGGLTTDPSFVVSEIAPTNTNAVWLNPKA